ncbi:aquaporin [Tricholoma matsutake]|nr:aquaporin [Tricholoma matsutake 945]
MAQARFTSSGSNDISISQYAGQDYAKTTSEAGGLHEFHAEYQVPKDSWWKYRQMLREAAAEFTGVMILTIFGNGAVCQTVLSSNPAVTPTPKGGWLSLNFGWAIGVALGVWVSGGISGGHINPAVTLALATFRRFPWKKVPVYIFAQLMGGLVGSTMVYANYFHAIDIFEGGRGVRTLRTASLFATYAVDYMTNVSCFFSEFLGTAMLMMVILAGTDKRNNAPPAALLPLVLFIVILGIGTALGMETGYALNPARDLGPRLLTSMVGYGKAVYTYRNQYWIWCPIIAPILGAQAAALFYDAFLYNGEDSLFSQL